MAPPTEWETDRLHLRPVRRSDAAEIFSTYAGDAAATRYMNFARHRSLAESEAFAERCEAAWKSGSAFPWAIIERASDAFSGVIELRLAPPKADFGYILGPQFWGRGLATEAASAIVAWAAAQPSIFRVWATCHPDNTASASVLRKAGLTLETTLANWEARPQLGEAAGASHCYALIKNRR